MFDLFCFRLAGKVSDKNGKKCRESRTFKKASNFKFGLLRNKYPIDTDRVRVRDRLYLVCRSMTSFFFFFKCCLPISQGSSGKVFAEWS